MSIEPNDSEVPQPPPEAECAAYPSLEELAHLLPQYEVHEIIGVGGMGAVYKGRQMALDRWVAIKVLPIAASQNVEDTQRFITEARAMAKLVHPHIVAVFDFGQTYQRHLFLVMEYVEGMDLHLRTRAGEITIQRAREVIAQLCDALQFAHDHGVAHRDIKPANILITNDWKVKVADFGLARDLTTQPNADEPEYGTPDYTAPERLIVGAVVDHRADIYALGVVIHEMLTGKTPSAAGKDAGKGLPAGFEGVISKCLMNEPERRYQKASEVKIALLTATSEKAIKTGSFSSQPAPHIHSSAKDFSSYEPPRFPGVMRGLGTIGWGLACVLLVGAFTWFLLKDKVSLDSADKLVEEVPITTPTPAIEAVLTPAPAPEMAEADARKEAPAAPAPAIPTPPMATPKVTREMEDPTQVTKDLPKAGPYTVPEGPFGEVARLAGHDGPVYDIELLQDEQRAVSVGMDGTLRVWDLHSQKELLNVDAGLDQLARFQVDADESRALIYSYRTDQLAMVDLTTGKLTHKAQFPDDTLTHAVLIPETKNVLLSGGHNDGTNNLYLWQPEIGEEITPVEGYVGRPYGMTLGLDGKSVIMNSSQILDKEKNTFRSVTSLYSGETGQVSPWDVKNIGYITRFFTVRGASQLLVRCTAPTLINLTDMSVSFALPPTKVGESSVLTGQPVDGGRLLLTAWSDSTLRIHETSKGEEVWRQTMPEPVTDICLSKDQRWAVFSTRYKDPKKQLDGDFDLLVWRMPKWLELQSTAVMETTIASQMADLAKHDPELASMRDNLRASFPPPDKAEFAAKKQQLDVLYVSALRRQIPSQTPTDQNSLKQEVDLITSRAALPEKSNDFYLPPVIQKLRSIYRDQLQALMDKETQSAKKVAQTVEGYLKPLTQKREATNDRLGLARVTALMKEWDPTSALKTTGSKESSGNLPSTMAAAATPTKRPDRPGNVIAIPRVAQNTSPMMPPAQVSRMPRDLGPVVAIAGGQDHVIALRPDGSLRAWGTWEAQPAVVPPDAKDVVQIDSSDQTALALCQDGKVLVWGATTAAKPTIWQAPAGKTPISVFAGGLETGYVLCQDGSLVPIGQINPPAPSSLGPVARLEYIHATGGWSALLRNGGEPVYWGSALPPVTPLPPDMKDLVSIGISTGYGVALQRDGTMTGWGQLAQDQRFRTRKFTGGLKVYHDYAGRVFPVHRSDHSWEMAPNPNIPDYISEDRSSVVEGRLRSCIDALFTRDYVIGLKP